MNAKTDTDEKAIRQLIEGWAAATRENRKNEILSGHASQAVIFDVLKPLQYKNTASYKRGWARWQPNFEIPSLFKIEQLKLTVGATVAFGHCLIRCGGKLPSGEIIKDVVRATICLKKDRQWRVVHQHISMPVSK